MQISNICQSYQQQRETLIMTATMSHSAFCRHNYLNNTQCPLQYFKMTKSNSGLETVLYMHRSYEDIGISALRKFCFLSVTNDLKVGPF